MEKKELNKIEIVEVGYRGYFILVCIILLCACGIICLLMNRLKNTTFENRELKDKIAEQTKDCPNNSIPVYLTQTDLINLLFTNKLNKEETITEYLLKILINLWVVEFMLHIIMVLIRILSLPLLHILLNQMDHMVNRFGITTMELMKMNG